MTKDQILIICGPSGSGKGTLVKHILETHQIFSLSISCTTRLPRVGEEDGVDYYFLTQKEFETKIANEEFAEYEEVYPGKYYGTLKSEIQRIQDLGKIPVFDIDYKGGLNLKKIYPSAIDIFLLPPDRLILEQRLRARGTETEEQIQTRLDKADFEISHQDEFTYKLVNYEWIDTIVDLNQILNTAGVIIG